jgi:hypothetical protein
MHEINQTKSKENEKMNKKKHRKDKMWKKHTKEKFTYVELLTNFQDATIIKKGCQKLKLAKSSKKS